MEHHANEKFGQPHHIVLSQSAKIQKFSPNRFNDLALLVEFADTVSSIVIILKLFGYSNNLFSPINLDIANSKLPFNTKQKWFAFIELQALVMSAPSPIQFTEWLQEESQIHERLMSSGLPLYKLDAPSSKFGKRFDFRKNPNSGESALSSYTDKDRIDSKFNRDHRIWNWEKIKNMEKQDRYNVANEKRLCFAYLSDSHAAEDCPRKKEMLN